MSDVRIEHDLLGEREVPNSAYWGIHTLRAIENFNISNVTISDVPEFVRGMVMVKKLLRWQMVNWVQSRKKLPKLLWQPVMKY
ncbi:Fumarate hydratase class II [Mannheimia haemolytica]